MSFVSPGCNLTFLFGLTNAFATNSHEEEEEEEDGGVRREHEVACEPSQMQFIWKCQDALESCRLLVGPWCSLMLH